VLPCSALFLAIWKPLGNSRGSAEYVGRRKQLNSSDVFIKVVASEGGCDQAIELSYGRKEDG